MAWLQRVFGGCVCRKKKKAKRNYTALAETGKKQDAKVSTMPESLPGHQLKEVSNILKSADSLGTSSVLQMITDNTVQMGTQLKKNIKNLSKALNDDIKELKRAKDEELTTIKDKLKAVNEKLQSVQESENILSQNQSNTQKQVPFSFSTGTPKLCPSFAHTVQAPILMAKDALASGSRDLFDGKVKRPKHNIPHDKQQKDVAIEMPLVKPASEEAGAKLQKAKLKKQVNWASSTLQSKPPAVSSISPPSVSTVPFSVAAKYGHLASERTPAKDLTSQRKEPPQPITPQRATRPKTKPSLHTVQKNQMSTPVKSYGHTTLSTEEEQQLRLEALKNKEQHEAERKKKLEKEMKQKQMTMKRKREERMRRVREAKVKIDNEKSMKIQEMVAQREERYKTMN